MVTTLKRHAGAVCVYTREVRRIGALVNAGQECLQGCRDAAVGREQRAVDDVVPIQSQPHARHRHVHGRPCRLTAAILAGKLRWRGVGADGEHGRKAALQNEVHACDE